MPEQTIDNSALLDDWNKCWQGDGTQQDTQQNAFKNAPMLLWGNPRGIEWLIPAFREYMNQNIVLNIIGERKYSNVAASLVHGISSTAIFFLERYQDALKEAAQTNAKTTLELREAIDFYMQEENKEHLATMREIMEGVVKELGKHPVSRVQLLAINLFVALRSTAFNSSTSLNISTVTRSLVNIFSNNLEGADNYYFRELALKWLLIPSDVSYEPVPVGVIHNVITESIKLPVTDSNSSDHVREDSDIDRNNSGRIQKHMSKLLDMLVTKGEFISNEAFYIVNERNGDGSLKKSELDAKCYVTDTKLTETMKILQGQLISGAGIRRNSYSQLSMILKTVIGMLATYAVNSFTKLSALPQSAVISLNVYSSVKFVEYLSNKTLSQLRNVMDVFNILDAQFQSNLTKLVKEEHIYPTVKETGIRNGIEVEKVECSPQLLSIQDICAHVFDETASLEALEISDRSAVYKVMFNVLSKRIKRCGDDKWRQELSKKFATAIPEKPANNSWSSKLIPNYDSYHWLQRVESSMENVVSSLERRGISAS
jgi:hypothetical protein